MDFLNMAEGVIYILAVIGALTLLVALATFLTHKFGEI